MGLFSTPDAPDPPDYAAAAVAQGEANKDAAYQTAVLSNPNIITPYGGQTTTWGAPNQGQLGGYNNTSWQNQSLAGGLYNPSGGTSAMTGSLAGGGSYTLPDGQQGNIGSSTAGPTGGSNGGGFGGPLTSGGLYNPSGGTGGNSGGQGPKSAYEQGGADLAARMREQVSSGQLTPQQANAQMESYASQGQGGTNYGQGPTAPSGRTTNGRYGSFNPAQQNEPPPSINGAVSTPPGAGFNSVTGQFDLGGGNVLSMGASVPGPLAGIPQATVNQFLSPTEQAKMDKNDLLQLSLLDTAQTGLGRVDNMMGSTFDMSGLQSVSSPSSLNAASYLSSNPDVAAWAQKTAAETGRSPEELAQEHYQQYGIYEGRQGTGNASFNADGMREFQGIDLNTLPQGGSLQAGGPMSGIDLSQLSPNGQLSTAGLNQGGSLSTEGLRGFESLNTAGLQDLQGVDLSQLSANGQFDQNTLNQLQGVNTVDPSQLDPYSVQASVGGLQQVTDAIRSRGDEDFQRSRRDLESDLIARGFTPGSEGFNERMNILDRQQNDFNQQALLAGGQEQSRIAGLENQRRSMGLNEQQAQFVSQLGLRGQQLGEQSQVAQFAQQLRAQGLTEQQIQSQFNNAMRGQQFNERARVSDDASRQRMQEFGENTGVAVFNKDQRDQQFQEQEAIAQFAQQLRAQGLTEQQVSNEVERANRLQQFGEQTAAATFDEAQRAGRLGEQQTQAGVNNAIRSQQFGERGALASFDQSEQQRQYQNQLSLQQAQAQERQRQIQEQAYLRQLPLNEINALRSGSQTTLPQFQAYSGANVQAAPIFDAAAAQGNYDMAAYQNRPDVMGGLFQLGGAVAGGMFGGPAGAAAGASAGGGLGGAIGSDVNLKENIVKIGEIGGLNAYRWDWNGKGGYKGSSKGFIAQEVMQKFPEHVYKLANGYFGINYNDLLEVL